MTVKGKSFEELGSIMGHKEDGGVETDAEGFELDDGVQKYQPLFFDIETTGLNPMVPHWYNQPTARVICVGVGYFTGDWTQADTIEDVGYEVEVLYNDSEYNLLKDVRTRCGNIIQNIQGGGWEPGYDDSGTPVMKPAGEREVFIVGYSNRGFDHPYYGARAARLRQSPFPFGSMFKRLDIKNVVYKLNGKYTSQDDWCDMIGISREEDITGKEVPKLFENNNTAPIIRHCKLDIEDLMNIFLHDKDDMMGDFYEHYGIDADPSYVENVDI